MLEISNWRELRHAKLGYMTLTCVYRCGHVAIVNTQVQEGVLHPFKNNQRLRICIRIYFASVLGWQERDSL